MMEDPVSIHVVNDPVGERSRGEAIAKIDLRPASGVFLSGPQLFGAFGSRTIGSPNPSKLTKELMRGIIIKSVSPEDVQNMRRLQAIEGYVYLGLFEEAEEELHELDPAWYALRQTQELQLRVLAGLGQTYELEN